MTRKRIVRRAPDSLRRLGPMHRAKLVRINS